MKEEISKVLTLVQEGKIDSEKGSELIQVLQNKEDATLTKRANGYLDKMLKIRVVSQANENVNVNLPLKLIKVLLKAGFGIAGNIPEAAKYTKDINIDLILEAIENEIDGPIVDVTSANGDKVSIVIE